MSIKTKVSNYLIGKGLIDVDNHIKSLGLGVNDPFIIWNNGKKIPARQAMKEYKGWAYAATRAIAESVASINIKLMKVNSDGKAEEIIDHEILDLLHAMNKFQTGFETIYNTAATLTMTGNAYWLLSGVEDDKDKPSGIFFLPAQDVEIVRGKTVEEMIKGYMYTHENEKTLYSVDQILHFKMPDPNDMVEGLGVVGAIAAWIDEDNFATEFNRRFFKQGARLGGFLESEKAMTPEQMEYLTKSFEKIYTGLSNAHKVASLPSGVKFVDAQSTRKDMDFSEGQRTSRDKILSGFKVPKTILGAAESETNRATAETAKFVFADQTVKPMMKLIVMWINEFIVPRYGDDIFLSFDDPTPENRELAIEEMKTATGGQPVMSTNEARGRYFDAPPIENGEKVLRDIRMSPIGAPEESKAIISSNKSKKTEKTIIRTRFAQNAKSRKKIAGSIAHAAIESLKTFEKNKKKSIEKAKKDITKMTDDEYEFLWKAFVSRVDPFEIKLFNEVVDFNEKQREEVLKNLKEATKEVNQELLFNKGEWVSALTDLATPIVVGAYLEEIEEATSLLGFADITGLTPEAQAGLDKGIELMADSYNETTLKLLKEKLEIAIAEGKGFDELVDMVNDIFDFNNEVRARQIARTEVFRAANFATQQGWKQTDVVKTMKWYTSADERVCEFCFPLHNRIIDIDDKFFELGDTLKGVDGGVLNLNYTEINHPPLHVSCRCYLRPEEITLL